MKVTLCYPSLLPGRKPTYGLQPLGVLYIAAVLKRDGFDVNVIDADVDGLTIEEMVARILASEPELVGLSLMTPQLLTSLAVASLLKKARPELVVVLGGAHIDSTKDDVFKMADCFDAAIHGEGEYPLLEICQHIRQHGPKDLETCLEGVSNVIYRDRTGKIVVHDSRSFLNELDDLPSVDYDLIDIHKYSIPTMAGKYVLSMMLSRGCPFKCTFCDAPITMGTKLRFWSTPRVLADIRHYVEKYGVTNFVFKDSTFTAKKKWAYEFCQALVDSGIKIKWRCNTRVNLVEPGLLELMKKAGCYVINFGVESGSPEILKRIKKEVDLKEVYDAHERCRKLGIRTYATFLMGNPGETAETAQQTIDLATSIRPSLAMFFVSTAYPGTPMYDDALVEGNVRPRWWADQEWDARKNSAFQVRWGWTDSGALKIPGFDSEAWQRKATRAFYFRPRFMWDTFVFTLKNPSFLRHIWNLGKELIPFYRIRNLFPARGRKLSPKQKQDALAKCPSAPTVSYVERTEATSGHLPH
jgi:anaerobic magnesium-protoporphyrin IX monomethyl ester cyclase